MPISVNMFGERFTTDCHIRTKNGQPPHSTTGVARANSTKESVRGENQAAKLSANSIRDIASTNSGTVNTAHTQNRRDMSTSSGFVSAAVTVRGSSAMPHFGQLPG